MQNHRKIITSMLIIKLGQHLIILRKLWMKKQGVILDIKKNWLIFWPKHCQHAITTKPFAAKLYAEKPHADKPHTDEPHAEVLKKTILKQLTNTWPKLLPYLLPNTQDVSKIVSTQKMFDLKKSPKPCFENQKKRFQKITYLRDLAPHF